MLAWLIIFISKQGFLGKVKGYGVRSGLPKKRQGATRSDKKRQEAFKQFSMLKMSKIRLNLINFDI